MDFRIEFKIKEIGSNAFRGHNIGQKIFFHKFFLHQSDIIKDICIFSSIAIKDLF